MAGEIEASGWVCNANEVIQVHVHGGQDRTVRNAVHSFHPDYTYPIFEQERIYGYHGLAIDIHLTPQSLRIWLQVRWDDRVESVGKEGAADDVVAILAEWLPEDYTTDQATFEAWLEAERKQQETALGTLLVRETLEDTARRASKKRSAQAAFAQGAAAENGTSRSEVVEIREATWMTDGFKALHRRAQIMVPFLIEGGSYLEEDDDKWAFYLLYSGSQAAPLTFVGYASVYRFWAWPDNARCRLAQMVILPSFQGRQLGSRLYQAIHAKLRSDPDVIEMTVEDPNERFSDMRDRCDYRQILPDLVQNHILPTAGIPWQVPSEDHVTRLRLKHKLAERQFSRCLEMALRASWPNLDHPLPSSACRLMTIKECQAFRLWVKRRLYLLNRDVLIQMPGEKDDNPKDEMTRKEALKETWKNLVEGDYDRLLAQMQTISSKAG